MTSKNNRRVTLSVVPSLQKLGSATNRVAPTPNQKVKPNALPKSRKSMIPRLGRDNTPVSPENDVVNHSKGHRRTDSSMNSDVSNRKDRRSSILAPLSGPIGLGPRHVQDKDPRPILDNKSSQQQCIRKLVDFLTSNDYQYPVSVKSLSRPSAKDFSNIVSFMLRMIDPNFQHGSTMKFEDEVSLNFKCLGYPFTLSKTALVAAGSANTWPSLLAALTWLMERLCAQQAYVEEDFLQNPDGCDFTTIDELGVKSEMAFYQYLGKSYTAFLTEDMPELERMEVALSDRFLKDDELLERKIESMTEVNMKYMQKIKELESESSELPSYLKKREDYAADLEQFHDLIRQMKEHKASLEKKVNEKQEELLLTNNQLASKTRLVEEMKKTIANQELSMDDMRKLESEVNEMKQTFDHKSALKEKKRKILRTRESELVKFCFNVDSVISNYNAKVIELIDLPEMTVKAATVKARFNKENLLSKEQIHVVGVEVQPDIVEIILSSRDDYREKHAKINDTFQDDLDTMEEMENRRKVVSDKLSSVIEKKAKTEQAIENELNTMANSVSLRQEEVAAIEARVTSLHDPASLEKQMAAYERQCSELEILRTSTHDEYMSKKRDVASEIKAACEAMAEFENGILKILAEAKCTWQKRSLETTKLVSTQYFI